MGCPQERRQLLRRLLREWHPDKFQTLSQECITQRVNELTIFCTTCGARAERKPVWYLWVAFFLCAVRRSKKRPTRFSASFSVFAASFWARTGMPMLVIEPSAKLQFLLKHVEADRRRHEQRFHREA